MTTETLSPFDAMPDSRLLTAVQAADYLNVSPGTVRNWAMSDAIPYVLVGKVKRYRKGEIDSWLERERLAEESELEEARKAALSKLTEAERRILGV